MADTIFELSAKLGIDVKDFERGLDKAENGAEKSGKNIGQSLKNAASVTAKAFATMATAAAAAIASLATSAVKAYAEYEQLVGGVDTLFKEASAKLQDYANKAYMTTGMSANDFMANATAFSASLIASLGGDTQKAADYANRAMVSMSDNANKMGTSIDSIVQTYQSLSRGNFAMLDNLKLGYGGTKSELERLIKDAASYTDIQKKMNVEVKKGDTSFANIVNAIAVVQEKLGIAGATAAEASTTIEGSLNSAKAAWSNLIVGIADDNQDFGKLINNFVETIAGDRTGKGGVVNNILPRISKALKGVGKLIGQLAPVIVREVPKIINDILPELVSAAGDVVNAIFDALPGLVEGAVDVLPRIIDSITKLFTEKNIVDKFLKAISSLIQTIAQNLGPITETLVAVIPQIVESLNTALKNNIGVILNSIIDLILEIVKNAPILGKALAEQIGPIIETIFDVFLSNIDDLVLGVAEILGEIFSDPRTIFSIIDGLIKGIVNSGVNLWNALISGKYNDDFSNLFSGAGSNSGNKYVKIGTDTTAVSSSAAGSFDGKSVLQSSTKTKESIGVVNITVNGGESPEQTARAVAESLENMMNRRSVAGGAY